MIETKLKLKLNEYLFENGYIDEQRYKYAKNKLSVLLTSTAGCGTIIEGNCGGEANESFGDQETD